MQRVRISRSTSRGAADIVTAGSGDRQELHVNRTETSSTAKPPGVVNVTWPQELEWKKTQHRYSRSEAAMKRREDAFSC